ncbi:hypothetical protein [Lacipirellula limnantheis]|uniref:Uncharacterized protein n=1 Tax=Lacipirellula limnantheis TaxID=2528024 RepID=A0A517TRL8_9BACT|nr:hypothetical protein [Lacipirellula limnantheis]QDT70998.1 hypothetical protein I41_01530 [Lacipirellula limnantheis]
MRNLSFKDWMEVVAAIATAGGLLYLMYGDYFKRPLLEVSFVPKRDVTLQGNTPDPFIKGNSFARSIWIRICVVNRKVVESLRMRGRS